MTDPRSRHASERCIARSTVPGYSAVAADVSLVSVDPVTAVPMSCGVPVRAPAMAAALPPAVEDDASLFVTVCAPKASAPTAAMAATALLTFVPRPPGPAP